MEVLIRSKRPRIGITMRYEVETERFYLARFYGEAVEAAGGLPFYLPLIPDAGYVTEVVSELDGVLLPGSASDVDPRRYGMEPHPKLGSVHPLRDEMDSLLLYEVEQRNLPLLAICYGMQMLNVFRGGTLIQDIEQQVKGAIKHEQGAPRERRSHRIKFLEESRLAQLNGGVEAYVNSHHHQGIETVGRNLIATAWTADGLVEGLEDIREERFVIGVQWHPELDWRDDSLSGGLFTGLIETAGKEKGFLASDNKGR